MAEQYYYIDPAALSYLPELPRDEVSIKRYLIEFIKLQEVLASRMDCRFMMERSMAEQLSGNAYSTNVLNCFIPLDINDIKNNELKSLALMARNFLFNLLSKIPCFIEMQYCTVESNINIAHANAKHLQDNFYGDYLYLMLGNECCNHNVMQHSDEIIIIPNFTRLTGDSFSMDCKCKEKSFTYICKLVPYLHLENSALKHKKQLRSILQSAGFDGRNICSSIVIKQAPHEPIINNTIVKKYTDIPGYLRIVLDELCYFGLLQVDLRQWGSHSGTLGSLHNCEYVKPATEGEPDCIKAWLVIDDRSCLCLMYFPAGVGKLLLEILESKLEVKGIRDLKEEIYY